MRVLSFLTLLTVCVFAQGQQFSKEWIGEWRGELEIHNVQGLQQKVAMGLNIASKTDSTWAWQIIYEEGESQDFRDYELKTTDDPGQYILDEKNSILLYLSYVNNTFLSEFELMGTRLLITYEMDEEGIVFRTVTSTKQESLKSGGTSENIPEVKARKIRSTQIARLKKK